MRMPTLRSFGEGRTCGEAIAFRTHARAASGERLRDRSAAERGYELPSSDAFGRSVTDLTRFRRDTRARRWVECRKTAQFL